MRWDWQRVGCWPVKQKEIFWGESCVCRLLLGRYMVLETHVFEIWDVSVKEIFKWTHLFFIQFLSKFKATQFSLLFFWIYFFNLFLLIFLFLFREICWYGFSFCFYSYAYEFSVKSNREARFWCTEKGQGNKVWFG